MIIYIQITKSLNPTSPNHHITSVAHTLLGKSDVQVTCKLLKCVALLVCLGAFRLDSYPVSSSASLARMYNEFKLCPMLVTTHTYHDNFRLR
jgi:hypothetical protein